MQSNCLLSIKIKLFFIITWIHINFVLPPVMTLSARLICDRIPGLTAQQKKICQQRPQSLAIINSGFKIAINECMRQFRHNRWNCTLKSGSNIFSPLLLKGTRESAYSYAIVSAGVTYTISQACSRGRLSFCGCHQMSKADKHLEESASTWKWSGCTPNVEYGIKLTKKFIDSKELDKEMDSKALMNLHNNNVGRNCVKDLLVSQCKCHGISGSCSARTCWQILPPFTSVGDYLMQKYMSARRVSIDWSKRSDTSGKSVFDSISSNGRRMGFKSKQFKRDFVYLDKSDNYCQTNPLTDSLGTSGRLCTKSSDNSDGCRSMCCGRGYKARQYVAKWKCRCTFRFCCTVECDECTRLIELFVCK